MKTSVKSNYSPPIMGRGKGVGLHYLKIALRNMRRFKLQTIVCLTGLAVGMTCFALGTLWLRYIESFEDFVPDREKIYYVTTGKDSNSGCYNYFTAGTAGRRLKNRLPQVVDYCYMYRNSLVLSCSLLNESMPLEQINASLTYPMTVFCDTTFLRWWGIEAIEGSVAHLNENEVILTESFAKRLFGDEKALGQQLFHLEDRETEAVPLTVTAIVRDSPRNTQFSYEALTHYATREMYRNFGEHDYVHYFNTFMKMHEAAEMDSIVERDLTIEEAIEGGISTFHYFIAPLSKLRSDYVQNDVTIQTSYVRWFMLLGLLVIACSLFNYVITMVSHIRRRGWEMSLRRVLGASRRSILVMVSVEAFIMFVLAAILSYGLTLLVLPEFREYSNIYDTISLSDISLRLTAYLAAVIAGGMLASVATAWVVMWRIAPQPPKGGVYNPDHNSPFRGLGGLLQKTLSMGILFAVVVMLRQVNYIKHSGEIGFDHRDMGIAYYSEQQMQAVRQSPLVQEMLEGTEPFFPKRGNMYMHLAAQGKTQSDDYIQTERFDIDEQIAEFYRFKLVAGSLPVAGRYKSLSKSKRNDWVYADECGNMEKVVVDDYPLEICINEAMCRKMQIAPENAVGQKMSNGWPYECVVSGVLQDIYNAGPTMQPEPAAFFHKDDFARDKYPTARPLIFRAKPGKLQELCDSLCKIPEGDAANVTNAEQEYEKFIASEQMLIKILFAVGGASLFVCVIGTFSLVSLSLQQRRKEIAIRKVHGATAKDILSLFLKGQVISLLIAALLAYPISYIIMQHWLEGYPKQVGIDWWLIPTTFAAIALVVLTAIALKIWRAARESTVSALNS